MTETLADITTVDEWIDCVAWISPWEKVEFDYKYHDENNDYCNCGIYTVGVADYSDKVIVTFNHIFYYKYVWWCKVWCNGLRKLEVRR